MTNDAPPSPMKKRTMVNPKALCTSPVNAVGMALAMRVMNSGIRGPNLSTKGPNRNRTKKDPDTAAIEDVQICCLVNPRSC